MHNIHGFQNKWQQHSNRHKIPSVSQHSLRYSFNACRLYVFALLMLLERRRHFNITTLYVFAAYLGAATVVTAKVALRNGLKTRYQRHRERNAASVQRREEWTNPFPVDNGAWRLSWAPGMVQPYTNKKHRKCHRFTYGNILGKSEHDSETFSFDVIMALMGLRFGDVR